MHFKNTREKKVSFIKISNQSISPWIAFLDHHTFGHELGIAKDSTIHHAWTPNPLFEWIVKNKAEQLLLSALNKCCPVFPVIGHKNLSNIYLSPPPEMSGSATAYIIIGLDSVKKLRAVGCNYQGNKCIAKKSADFFLEFDTLDSGLKKSMLIEAEIRSRMTETDEKLLNFIRYEGEKYRTLPVVVMVLDDTQNTMFAIDTALIKPNELIGHSVEFAGEVT